MSRFKFKLLLGKGRTQRWQPANFLSRLYQGVGTVLNNVALLIAMETNLPCLRATAAQSHE
jgi:hypothetical protein